MRVSERSIAYAAELRRSGRDDLVAAVERSETTIAAALRQVTGRRLPDRYEKIVLAWNRASDDDRARFLVVLANMGVVELLAPDDGDRESAPD